MSKKTNKKKIKATHVRNKIGDIIVDCRQEKGKKTMLQTTLYT